MGLLGSLFSGVGNVGGGLLNSFFGGIGSLTGLGPPTTDFSMPKPKWDPYLPGRDDFNRMGDDTDEVMFSDDPLGDPTWRRNLVEQSKIRSQMPEPTYSPIPAGTFGPQPDSTPQYSPIPEDAQISEAPKGLLDIDRTAEKPMNIKGLPNSIISDRAPEDVTNVLSEGKDVLKEYGITTPERQKHFLAQMSHESGGFRHMEEQISDEKAEVNYGPNSRVGKVLGNTEPGDGAKYKGRGIIQLTGRYNYKRYGDLIGVDLVNNPELASDPKIALKIAAAFWQEKGLNNLADAGNIREITRRINGGYNGLQDRAYRLRQLTNFTGF